METHDSDATAGGDDWRRVADDLEALRARLRDTYHRVADESAPSEEAIRDAFGTIAGAWDQVAETVGAALRDPDVREQVRQAASSVAAALGATVSRLAEAAREASGEEE